jgi:tetratricopeptide (TPR) repeat protein
MSEEAIQTLEVLARRLREAGDAATAAEVLPQAKAIAQDETLAPSRRLGAALADLAAALVGLGDLEAVRDLFKSGQRVLQSASDTRLDDLLWLWHNLGVLYERYGVTAARDELFAHIAHVAEIWTGPVHGLGAEVLVEQAAIHHRAGRVAPMKACLRQVHRVRDGADQSVTDRISWLRLYADMLSSRDCSTEAAPLLEEAIGLAHEAGATVLEVELLAIHAVGALERGDVVAALQALDRALPQLLAPALAGTRLAAAVWGNFASVVLKQGANARYAEALALCTKAIELMRRLGEGETDEYAYMLYYRGQLWERIGRRADAVPDYRAAAKVSGAARGDAAEWESLAGNVLFESGNFDAASDCYLAAVRNRIAATESPAT